MKAVFKVSAFRHGYQKADFYEVLASHPLKRRSLRGIQNVYELFGKNAAGDYLHILYRRSGAQTIVFHISRMTKRQRAYYQKRRR